MFGKKNRITSSVVFKEVFSQGEGKEKEGFKIIFKKNNLEYSRCGVIVSMQVSKSAVQRNILKRKIKNILRDFLSGFSKGLDFVIIAKSESLKMNFSKLRDSLNRLLNLL